MFEIKRTLSSGDETSGHGRRVGHERLQRELLSGDTELDELGFVHSDRIVVGLRCVRQRVAQVTQDTVLRLDSFLHVLADVIHSRLVETTSLNELAEGELLALELLLEDSELLVENFVLILSAALQLRDGKLELLVHIVFLLLDLAVLLVELGLLLLDSSHTSLEIF